MTPEDRMHPLTELLEISFENHSVEDVLARVGEITKKAIPNTASVSITVSDEKGLRSAAATDELAEKIGAREYELGEGPCVACLASHQVEYLESAESPDRWAAFAKVMKEFGARSALGIPLGADAPGALNVYSTEAEAFDEEAIGTAQMLALYAGVAVKNAQSFRRLGALVEQLNEGMRTREMIGKAIGILMEREGKTEEEAFQILKAASQSSNTKLRDIAAEVVQRSGSPR